MLSPNVDGYGLSCNSWYMVYLLSYYVWCSTTNSIVMYGGNNKTNRVVALMIRTTIVITMINYGRCWLY